MIPNRRTVFHSAFSKYDLIGAATACAVNELSLSLSFKSLAAYAYVYANPFSPDFTVRMHMHVYIQHATIHLYLTVKQSRIEYNFVFLRHIELSQDFA